MELTSYNSYTITPGRWNPFNSADLAEMAAADAKIEAEFSARYANMRPSVARPGDDPAAQKRAYNRQYYEANRNRIHEQRREHRQSESATHKRERTMYYCTYWQMNKDRINEQRQLRRAAKKAAT